MIASNASLSNYGGEWIVCRPRLPRGCRKLPSTLVVCFTKPAQQCWQERVKDERERERERSVGDKKRAKGRCRRRGQGWKHAWKGETTEEERETGRDTEWKKNEWREREKERRAREREQGGGCGFPSWLLLIFCKPQSASAISIHFLHLSLPFSSLPPPPCTQLRHPPYTSSSSSHSPSLHHHPSQPPIYFPICRPVSLPYIPEALSHGTHISFSRPIAPSLSMISISLSLTVYLYSTTSSRFMSKWKNTGESGWTEMIDERIDDR